MLHTYLDNIAGYSYSTRSIVLGIRTQIMSTKNHVRYKIVEKRSSHTTIVFSFIQNYLVPKFFFGIP